MTRHTPLSALPGTLLAVFGHVALQPMAFADDSEILTGQIGDYAAPNIMFIVDTSGSMDAQVLTDRSYDAMQDYDGPFDDDSRLYFTLGGIEGTLVYPDATFQDSLSYLPLDNLVCNAANGPLTSSGFYVDRIIQWYPQDEVWNFLSDADGSREPDSYFECARDLGVHGLDTSATFPVAGSARPPFTNDPDNPDRFDWSRYRLNYALFTANYMNWIVSNEEQGTPVVSTRLKVVKDVTRSLIDRLTTVNDPRQAFNLGLMQFSSTGEGGMVLQPAANIVESRDSIVEAVDSLTSNGSTPLVETLFEAYQYYRGGPVIYGAESEPVLSTEEAIDGSGSAYLSPITASCQKNYVVLLTDGQPIQDNDANEEIAALSGAACSGNCLDELARYISRTDLRPGTDDVQSVDTFTIGFFTDSQLLSDAATGIVPPPVDQPDAPPREGYFLASDPEELQRAFNTIFDRIETDVATFTAPAISIDSVNRLQNRDIVYFTMFTPSPRGEPRWDGNLKAYRVGRINDNDELLILDSNNQPALSDGGSFKEQAQSFWSSSPDGGAVSRGGFVSHLGLSRNVYTDVAGSTLSSSDNRVSENNDMITVEDLGIAIPPGVDGSDEAEARRVELLRMASGLTEDGQARRTIGDPLHTQPLVLTYAGDEGNVALFMSTNDGYLHRVDARTDGSNSGDLEDWAYLPSELLPNLETINTNPPQLPGSAQKLYGLDGPLTALIDGDDDRIVDPGEDVLIYSAMRRGGRNYYALDLGPGGDDAPRLAFKIKGGGSADSPFAKLGQTWSAAQPTRMVLGAVERDVLIFGGGYDPVHDSRYAPGTGGMGAGVFIVDARSGELLWRAGNDESASLQLSDMIYPIPSDLTLLDMNQDGLTDRIYVGDLGGQVWRIDNVDGVLFGAVHAKLGRDATAGDQRRFFNAPSVARILSRDDDFLAVSIGSGWRAHPLATENNDRLYVLKDQNVFAPQVDADGGVTYPEPLTDDDLVALELGSAADASDLRGRGGWYLPLGNGEKSLSRSLIADNRVFFTTYRPGETPLGCQPTSIIGAGRLYALDIVTGEPALVNADGEDVDFLDLATGGIPPQPQLVFVEPPCVSNCDVLTNQDPDDDDQAVFATLNGTCINPGSEVRLQVGLSGLPANICTAPVPSYWSEATQPAEDL
ncbi:MAG: PilC/PilY family type IV pilus protein [Pseudomonadota bacterium]